MFDLKNQDSEEVAECKMQMPDTIVSEPINLVDKLPGNVVIESGLGPVSTPGTLSVTAQVSMSVEGSGYMPGSPTSPAASVANTTAAAAPPSVTPSPTSPPPSTNDVLTKTSVTVIDGTVYHWLILEEVVTTTVMVDTPAPTGQVKRHLHAHRRNQHR